MSDAPRQRLDAAIWAQRSMGMKGDNWDNYAVARDTLHGDLGYNGDQREPYHLDETTRDTLLAHARQDAAHALCNTTSLLKRVRHLTIAVYLLIALVVLLIVYVAATLSRLGGSV